MKAAFDSSLIEGQTQTYRLQDISPSAFRLLAKWFYSDKIDLHVEVDIVTGDGEDNEDDEIPHELDKAWRAQDLDLAQLWVAGDQLLIPRLQNAVILAWHELWTNVDDARGAPQAGYLILMSILASAAL